MEFREVEMTVLAMLSSLPLATGEVGLATRGRRPATRVGRRLATRVGRMRHIKCGAGALVALVKTSTPRLGR